MRDGAIDEPDDAMSSARLKMARDLWQGDGS